MVGYARIWWDMLGYGDMMGYGGICWDMHGNGGICEGGSARGEKPLHRLCKGFLFAPPMVSTFD